MAQFYFDNSAVATAQQFGMISGQGTPITSMSAISSPITDITYTIAVGTEYAKIGKRCGHYDYAPVRPPTPRELWGIRG